MKALRTVLVLAALAAAPLLPLVLAQSPGGAGNSGSAAVQSALRIVAPAAGQVLKQNFVVVKYELTNQGMAGGSPNFRVQLDARDPVTTTFSEYTFTGLAPGEHTVVVELVDANGTPILGARSEVHFNVVQPRRAAPGTAVANLQAGPRLQEASLSPGDGQDLPPGGSALPLLSVIGFGALLGGIASALRTR